MPIYEPEPDPARPQNTPGTTPKFPGRSGINSYGQEFKVPSQDLMSVSKILAGTEFPVMFAPDQTLGEWTVTDPPVAWCPPGSLLRVPKCIYLNSSPPPNLWGANFKLISQWAYPAWFGHYNDAQPHDPGTPPSATVPFGSDAFSAAYGYDFMGWVVDPQIPANQLAPRWQRVHCTVPNTIVTEHLRLIQVFQEVKAYIEATYPNECFVHICDFFPNAPVTAATPFNPPTPFPITQAQAKSLDFWSDAGMTANAGKDFMFGPTWMLGPNSMQQYDQQTGIWYNAFFGTDLLHIFCGYQSLETQYDNYTGSLLEPDTLQAIKARTCMDYRMGPDKFNVAPPFSIVDAGYLATAYGKIEVETTNLMLYVTPPEGPISGKPSGKLSVLQTSYNFFPRFSTLLFNYDCTWNFGTMPVFGNPSGRVSTWPNYTLNYEDQEWTEGTIILQYAQRQADDPNPDGDDYYPGFSSGPYGETYNFFQRIPSTATYKTVYNPQLQAEWTGLKNALASLTNQCQNIWNDLINQNQLDELGFSTQGGSSQVTTDYLVQLIINYYGLQHYPGEPGGSD